MPLTPEDVENTRFTTVRLREGYDMQEVDLFLDEVQEELGRLTRENSELRDKLAAVLTDGGTVPPIQSESSTAAPVAPVVTPEPTPVPEPEPDPVVEPEPEPEPVPVASDTDEPTEASTERTDDADAAPVAPAAPVVPAQSTASGVTASVPAGAAGSPERAFDVLTYAQRTADQLVADARTEADRLLSDAQARAEQLDADSKERAEGLESDARRRADDLDTEVASRRHELFDKLESEQARLDQKVEGLRAFEREYRSRLKVYLENELRKLESVGMESSGSGRPVAGLLDDGGR